VSFGGATGSMCRRRAWSSRITTWACAPAQLSTAEKDYVKNGFYAPTLADELKVPGMSLRVLQSIEDVTARWPPPSRRR